MTIRVAAIAATLCAPSIALASCSSSSSSPSPAQDAAAPVRGDYDSGFGGARPVQVYVPSTYTDAVPSPLVVMLHGYGVVGGLEEAFLRLQPQAEARGFLYAHPDGTFDSSDARFWNATDGCCNFDGKSVDDSAYLASLVREIGTRYRVDPKRVYFVGHSNGGFMSYRMACDHADMIAAIVSLAGATFLDTSKCAPSQPVAVLQVHGTADTEVKFDGETGAYPYPGAKQSVEDWATYDGCALTPDTASPNLDIEGNLAGAETSVTKYASGCRPGGHAELWTIPGGGHIPNFTDAFAPLVVDFLFAHAKP